MEVAPFFVDFHHFLSIFTIFIDFHDLRTFVAIYILLRFTHFFRNFFLPKIAFSATSHVFCMYEIALDFQFVMIWGFPYQMQNWDRWIDNLLEFEFKSVCCSL